MSQQTSGATGPPTTADLLHLLGRARVVLGRFLFDRTNQMDPAVADICVAIDAVIARRV